MIKKRSTFLAAFSVGAWAAELAVCAGCALAATLRAPSFAQALERPQSSLELIDPKVLRVCADPHNMPFSNEKGEGFENKLAELFAEKLQKKLDYMYFRRRPASSGMTLGAHRCDVIMGFPQGDDLVQGTNPYYRTAYALVAKQGQRPRRRRTLEDERLKGKHIGIVAGTPPGTNMAVNGLMANAKPYPLDGRYPRGLVGGGHDRRSRGRVRSMPAFCGGRWRAITRRRRIRRFTSPAGEGNDRSAIGIASAWGCGGPTRTGSGCSTA
jgi:hypothetical protein